MKKARVLRNLGLAALALTAVSTAVWPRAAYAVFRNWTAGAIPLEESPVWTGGKQYLSVPYALDSESQYLDLYVPKPITAVAIAPRITIPIKIFFIMSNTSWGLGTRD